MSRLRDLPFGAMLLVATVPYHSWNQFAGTFLPWYAHRAALVAVLLVIAAWLVLRLLRVPPGTANIGLALVPGLAFLVAHVPPAIPLLFLAVALLAGLVDRQRAFENACLSLTVMGAVLFATSVTPVIRFMAAERQVLGVEPGTGLPTGTGGIALTRTPSIIHIVLDGYGGTRPLAEIYGHDTAPFFAELRRRGFAVIEEAVTPFSQTLPTMASVMSAAPVDISAYRGRPAELRVNLAHTIRHGPVPALLEAAGYTFARGDSGYGPLDFDATRVARPAGWFSPLDAFVVRPFGDIFEATHNAMLRASFAPGTLSTLSPPFFYYQHVIAPHPPFSMTTDGADRNSRHLRSVGFADGSHLIRGRADLREYYILGYREKITFVERALLAQIDALPTVPKVIVIHGDHGPGAFYDHENAEQTCLRERMTTFLAVYSDIPNLDDGIRSWAGERISIVNIYRAILSSISATRLPPIAPQPRHLPWSEPTRATPVSQAALNMPCMQAP